MINRYKELRPYMRTGDVLEWSTTKPVGRIIQRFSGKDVSHTSGVFYLQDYDRMLTVEAIGTGSSFTRISEVMESHNHMYWLQLKPEYDSKRLDIAQAQIDLLGTGYDFLSVGKSLFGHVSTDARKLYCTELIQFSFEQVGIIKPREKASWPGEVEDWGCFLPRVQIY